MVVVDGGTDTNTQGCAEGWTLYNREFGHSTTEGRKV